jgi:hypothetical protein
MPHHREPGAPAIPELPGLTQQSRAHVWLAAQEALVPIVGQGGFAALYQRCLHLAQRDHPWLAAADEDAGGVLRFESLLQALSQQPPARAAAAQEQLLRDFLDILANLIGPALVERLLGSVVVVPPNGPPEQDRLP